MHYEAYAKNIMGSLIDILREDGYSTFTDWSLNEVLDDLQNNIYNETYASGTDAQWHKKYVSSRLQTHDGKVLLVTVYSDKTARDLRGKVYIHSNKTTYSF